MTQTVEIRMSEVQEAVKKLKRNGIRNINWT